jgi:hypothetical protein
MVEQNATARENKKFMVVVTGISAIRVATHSFGIAGEVK